MSNRPFLVKFLNQKELSPSFDIIHYEELVNRKKIDHNLDEYHTVDFYILFLITNGEGIHSIDTKNYEYTQGSLFTISKNQIQKFKKSQNTRGYLLLFTEEFILSYLEHIEAKKTFQLFNNLIASPKIQLDDRDYFFFLQSIKRIEKEYHSPFDEHSLAILRSEIHILISRLYRLKNNLYNQKSNNAQLLDFIAFQNLVEANIHKTTKVTEYAYMMGKSPKTLNNLTKKVIHKTAKEFIDDIAIISIKRLLINTSKNVKEIAFESGFEEIPNFYKFFKRKVGDTPESFRSKY